MENELKEAKLEIQWMRQEMKDHKNRQRRGPQDLPATAWGSPPPQDDWDVKMSGSQTARPSGSQGSRGKPRKGTAGRKQGGPPSEAELFNALNLGGAPGGGAGGEWVQKHA